MTDIDAAAGGGFHGAAAHRWWVYALLGVLFLAMAAFVFGRLIAASIVSAIFFGAALAVGGAFQTVHAFWERGWGGFLLSLIVGILYVLGGLWLMANPAATSAALTLSPRCSLSPACCASCSPIGCGRSAARCWPCRASSPCSRAS